MKTFILLTFGFLGLCWYEMSGGSDFKVGGYTMARAGAAQESQPQVARADTGSAALITVDKVRAAPRTAAPDTVLAQGTAPKLDITLALVSPDAVRSAPADMTQLASASDIIATDAVDDSAMAEPEADLGKITGSRVNMRNGPGTRFSVVTQLTRGEVVEVLSNPGNGWLKLKSLETERVGWMSDDFVRVAAN